MENDFFQQAEKDWKSIKRLRNPERIAKASEEFLVLYGESLMSIARVAYKQHRPWWGDHSNLWPLQLELKCF